MALANFYDYLVANYVQGQTRVLYSQLLNGSLADQPVPAKITDVFATVSPYAPVATSGTSPWADLGSLTAPVDFVQTPAVNNVKIQQTLLTVKQIPLELVDTVKFTIAELNQSALIQMLHNTGPATSVASGSGYVAATIQQFGQYSSLNEYRFAIVSPLVSEAGLVTESGGTRQRFRMSFCNRCSMDASATTLSYALGEIVSAEMTFRLLPEPSADSGAELGGYITENVGTIS